MHTVFAPGCALMLYKPHLADKVRQTLGNLPQHDTCCRHAPNLPQDTCIINVCAGCDRRYRDLYPGITTVSLWERLAQADDFPFPDYGGAEMSIQDACPTRTEERVHHAVRTLLSRMNIRVVEPQHTRKKARCCGDSAYGALPTEQVKLGMQRRAQEMPCEDVAVYCVSCVKAMHIGGKRPRYLVDLLFGEPTDPQVFNPDVWHGQLQQYIDAHA